MCSSDLGLIARTIHCSPKPSRQGFRVAPSSEQGRVHRGELDLPRAGVRCEQRQLIHFLAKCLEIGVSEFITVGCVALDGLERDLHASVDVAVIVAADAH